MITTEQAIHAIRYVVQEHGNAHTIIGQHAKTDDIVWLTGLLGMPIPPLYLQILSTHDGVHVIDRELYSLRESFDSLMLFRDEWLGSTQFWPVADDGCGNYYVLLTQQKSNTGESPVAFLDHEISLTEPEFLVASSYAHFCLFQMARICAVHKDHHLISDYPGDFSRSSWPFDREFVLHYDPDLAYWQPHTAWGG